MRRRSWMGLALLAAAVTTAAEAHELAADRLSVVQRDERHLSLQFFVDLPVLLHRALAPQRPRNEFILALAAQPPEQLQQALQQFQARMAAETQVRSAQQPLALSRWRFPTLARVQAQLRQRAAQLVVAAHEHGPESELEMSVEALAPAPIRDASVQLPAFAHPLLVVSYRPRQRWTERPGAATPLAF